MTMTNKKNPIPLASLSLEELIALKSDIDKQIIKIQKVQKKEILRKMNEMAKEAGYGSVSDVAGGAAGRKPRTDKGVRLPAKYRSPDDPNKTWSGKGRAPQWILDYESKKGSSREDLLIA